MWSIDRIISFFRQKLSEFYTLPSRIAASRARAAKVREIAEKKGNLQAAAQLSELDNKFARQLASHATLQSRLAAIFAELGRFGIKISGSQSGTGTLGVVPVIPLAVVAAASAVAIAIAALLTDYAKQEKLLSQIEAGVLTPEEAKVLGAGRPLLGIDLGKLGLPIALALGAALLLPRLIK